MTPGMLELMRRHVARYRHPLTACTSARVLDVGALDVNGSHRPLIQSLGYLYTGLDIVPGRNVDIVSPSPYRYPLADGLFDLVISGSTMEHVFDLHRWMQELVRLIRPGGLLAIVTHWSFPIHRYPVDCWRILPDGFEWLFDRTGVLVDYQIEVTETDIAASAFRETPPPAPA